MPALTTDLCIGSYPSLPAQTMSVTINAVTEDVVLASRSYYLYDATAAGSDYSLLTRLDTALQSHSEAPTITIVLQRDLLVNITSDAAFTLTWPADGILRDLLGFTGNLTPSATSFTAANISPLVWSPGRTGAYAARYGTDGIPVYDTAMGQAATGIVRAVRHNSYRRNTVTWRYVNNARVWTTDEAGGEFFAFWTEVLSQGRRFKIYRETTEDSASSTAITYGTVLPSSGSAYVYTPGSSLGEMPFAREFGYHEYLNPITLPVVTAPEYTA